MRRDGELESLLADLESDRVERKTSISDTTRIRQAICAFANDLPNSQQPGVILVGVHDDGSCANLSITDRLLQTLADNPTVTGLLVVGKSPADFLPGDYIQFLRLDGTDLAAPILDQREIHGPMPELLRGADEIVRANIRVATDIHSAQTQLRQPDYPLVALQQLVRNAVMHRDYETSNAPVRITWFCDRVEVQNPGGPYGQVTVDNFGTPGITDYRNPTSRKPFTIWASCNALVLELRWRGRL